MGPNHDARSILDFLGALRDNNSREWFEANRPRYESARADFLAIVGDLLGRFDSVDDLGGIALKDCVFRINRDLRFSKDKTPYKTAMSALLGSRGRKSGARSYYFLLEPDGRSMLAGGLYDPSSAQLYKIRSAIALDAKPLKRILSRPEFVRYFGSLSGESLKTAPQGFEKDHPDIELLRLKQLVAIHGMSDKEVVAPDLVPHALEAFAAMKGFLVYLEKTLAD
jgi:uncharacterized protein (TIGR02453 family)